MQCGEVWVRVPALSLPGRVTLASLFPLSPLSPPGEGDAAYAMPTLQRHWEDGGCQENFPGISPEHG